MFILDVALLLKVDSNNLQLNCHLGRFRNSTIARPTLYVVLSSYL